MGFLRAFTVGVWHAKPSLTPALSSLFMALLPSLRRKEGPGVGLSFPSPVEKGQDEVNLHLAQDLFPLQLIFSLGNQALIISRFEIAQAL